MTNSLAFHYSQIRLLSFFMNPHVTKHFSVIAKKRHAVFPGRRNIFVLQKNDVSQREEATLRRFIFLQKVKIEFFHTDSLDVKIFSAAFSPINSINSSFDASFIFFTDLKWANSLSAVFLPMPDMFSNSVTKVFLLRFNR